MSYIAEARPEPAEGMTGEPFLDIPRMSDEDGLVVARGEHVYVVLNLYPYNPGHSMVVPYRKVANLEDLDHDESREFMSYTQHLIRVVKAVSNPDSFNVGLNLGAYGAEVVRGAIQSVPRGQWEAATALNLSPWRTYKDVIIPQAIPPVVPALGNYLIGMFKETPLLSAIAVVELMQTAKIIGSETFRYLEPITMVGVFFLIMSLISSAGVQRLEWWLKTRRG